MAISELPLFVMSRRSDIDMLLPLLRMLIISSMKALKTNHFLLAFYLLFLVFGDAIFAVLYHETYSGK